jgi:uncharacterized membrane-anchored protein
MCLLSACYCTAVVYSRSAANNRVCLTHVVSAGCVEAQDLSALFSISAVTQASSTATATAVITERSKLVRDYGKSLNTRSCLKTASTVVIMLVLTGKLLSLSCIREAQVCIVYHTTLLFTNVLYTAHLDIVR